MTPTPTTPDQADSPKDGRQRLLLAAGAILILILGFLGYQFLNRETVDLRALLIEARDTYHEPWTSVDEAAQALATPEAIVAFVSDRIAVSAYTGRLQDPVTVLETRVANPADKAMLLQAMLSAAGVETRAIAAPLVDDLRASVLQSAQATPIPLPSAMTQLMDYLDYDEDDFGVDQMADALTASYVLDQANMTVDAALERAQSVLDLDGPSIASELPLDWVWLETSDGTIYDPVLPEADRSDLARVYTAGIVPSTLTITARDRFGGTAEVVSWTGNAYGTDVDLAFLPTINMIDRLLGTADTSDINVWTPAIVVGDEVTTKSAVTRDGDVVPLSIVETLTVDTETFDVSGFTAPEIEALSVQSVDASQFPRVQLGLSASVQNTPNWHGAHFNLTVDDKRLPVRIETPFSTATEVIVVHDQSGSMREQGRASLARTFGSTLLGGLSATQRFALIAHNDVMRVQRLFDPLENVAQVNDPSLWDLPVRGTTSFLTGLEYALNAIEIDLGSAPEQQTSIVMVTDGETENTDLAAQQADLDELAERAQMLNAAVYPIILSPSAQLDFDSLAASTGGQVFRVANEDRVVAIAEDLARRLAGGMVISFEAPTDPIPAAGDVVPLALQVESYDGVAEASYTVPETVVASQPGIFVEISAGGLSSVRPVVSLGERYDPNAMTGSHQVFLAPGGYPQDRMVAHRLNRWLVAYDTATDNQEALEEHAASDGVSNIHAQTVQGLVGLTSAAMDDDQAMRFPFAVLRHHQVQTGTDSTALDVGDEMPIVTTLDVAPWSTFLSEPASRLEVARVGLALNDAEARLLGGGDNLTEAFTNAPGIQAASDVAGVLRADGDDMGYWRHDADLGTLYGMLNFDESDFKGSQDVVIAAKFKEIASLIDTYNNVVAPGVDALPTSSLYAGIVAFKKEELKLWCFSTIMLNYVSESIAGEEDAILDQSPAAAQARAAELCEIEGDPSDFGQRAARAAAEAVANAVWEEVKSNVEPVGGLSDAFQEPDVQAWVKDRIGAERLTEWIGDPTTRAYAEQIVGAAQDRVGAEVSEWVGSTRDSVVERLQQSGLGGGTGPSSGYPITRGLDAALSQTLTQLAQ